MRTKAEIKIDPRGYAYVQIETPYGYTDQPIMYDTGEIVYDNPYKIPKFIKPKVRHLLILCKKQNLLLK